MARLARVVIPHVAHHITQRGNRRLPIVFSDNDRVTYLDLLAASLVISDTRCLAWCLMDTSTCNLALVQRLHLRR